MSDRAETHDDRYGVQYSLYGADLDVDALLSRGRPKAEARVWHRGEAAGRGKPAATSGLQIQLVETGRAGEVRDAVARFLADEIAFLAATTTNTGPGVLSVISCRMWVYAKVPTGIWLEQALMHRMAELGIGWEVTGYPCVELDGP